MHDDIEDSDRERRHRPTLWALWGVPLAINAGDALFALSRLALYRLMKEEEYEPQKLLDVMRVYDETCLALCEGQYLDISFERRTDVTVDEYLEMISQEDGRADRRLDRDRRDDGQRRPRTSIEAYRRFGSRPGDRLPDRRRPQGQLLGERRLGQVGRGRHPQAQEDVPGGLGACSTPPPTTSRA